MPAGIENSTYAKALGEDGRIDLIAIQFFTTPQWEEWIVDRLYGRDSIVQLDPRQGEDPEFLFLDLILQLGKARDSAEYAIKNTLDRALQSQWEDKPLASLFYMIERLHVSGCILTLLRYLDTPFKMSALPYGRALAALAQFDKEYPVTFKSWRRWVERDKENLLPQCFRRLINFNPDIAIRLLGAAGWTNWQESPLEKALLNELDIYFFSTPPNETTVAGLRRFADDYPGFRDAVFTVLPAVGNVTGWGRGFFPEISKPSTFGNRNTKRKTLDIKPTSTLMSSECTR